MDPLDHPCPTCHAHRGERCAGGGAHHPERRALTSTREQRYYDQPNAEVPAPYLDPAPDPRDTRARVVHHLSDHARAVGLAGLAAARAALAQHHPR